jgi:murein DD-endopeptidase MepM/ murein hydrolase activator NlpD
LKTRAVLSLLVALALLSLAPLTARGQETEPGGPIYIVQPGDTLSRIAFQFGVSLEDLVAANDIGDANQLGVGDRLTIPGLQGVDGVLTTQPMDYGETLRSLSRRYQIPLEQLMRLNRAVSTTQIPIGAGLILPISEGERPTPGRRMLAPEQSTLELAALASASPWTLALGNLYESPGRILPDDVLLDPGSGVTGPGALPPGVAGVEVDPLPLVQGGTARIILEMDGGQDVGGSLVVTDLRNGDERPSELRFFPAAGGTLVALQGVHAMTLPGFYPLTLQVGLGEGRVYAFTQQVQVLSGGYVYDLPLTVPAATLDPDVTGPEDELWTGLTQPATPERLWRGTFESPSPDDCTTSRFGSRRSYNGSAYIYFHTGVDFCWGTGVPILAPAPGLVVFSGPLDVRGNAIMIDHGWGVYTGYMHQSELLVQEGQRVETGQEIGLVGGTGRVTGAHLHWEVWVGGIQVQPLQWLEQSYP